VDEDTLVVVVVGLLVVVRMVDGSAWRRIDVMELAVDTAVARGGGQSLWSWLWFSAAVCGDRQSLGS
jgi:hypothetical protein